MKQTKLEIQKALAEDSTVYEYDSIYDEMQKKKEENNPKLLLGKDRKPKYIHNLLKAVEIRKKEQEKRMEKKIQREREMEKGEFDDKEAFVTSAYKKKLQERAEEEEREKRAAALEAQLDVTKQKDLSGFYRHLLNQAVGEEEVPTCSFREARSEIKEEKPRGYSDEVSSEKKIPHEKSTLHAVVKVEDNPDADSDFDAKDSEDDEVEENYQVNCRRERGTETSEKNSKHHRNQTHSRSSSEEREHDSKRHTKSSRSRGHDKSDDKRDDRYQQRQSRGQENYYTEHDYQREKDSHRHREASHRDSHWKRHEQEDKLRGRSQRERNDRDSKREKDREKYTPREQERDKQRNEYHQHSMREEKEEKSKEKEEHRKERYENSDKYRDKEVSIQSSERKESCPNTRTKDEFHGQDRSNKMRHVGKDKESKPEKPSSSEISLDAKHRITEENQEMSKEQERPHETVNKFAKRSNEETVMSARDRYLARQMARVNAKTYIEKEDD
ncbi:nuclear speckle splicing regulatory protein 1 isoform X2 [Erinaceus europaeus]|nr:nuclear speckle splicing regulatory protein 1 isoform X2 [Erinaceus europaeus]XP_060060068.1 nuclear speckle splicing regulatory protein 1 isoform X2 [Erinaceus europaeus]XP_060060069.1 nuclear speckle splicing regulatory protein 1 isoform X2 [Erinaceus europaeus]XP_060060070.1 nuclear speckle splicing regulatory protein 1 isoform X2 [Erinaceus europaeus]